MNLDLYLLPQQEELIESNARYTLLSGGVGSGKSYGLIADGFLAALKYPGIDLLYTDSNWPSLRDTTYRDFFEVVPEKMIQNHNKTYHHVTFKNSSTVLFRAFDEPNKLKRYTFGGIYCEELTDLPQDIFKMARTRIRQIGYKGFFKAGTNPGNLQNWVYDTFIENPIKDSKVIYSKSVDNTFLPKEYLEDLESIKYVDQQYYDRMVLGKWGNLDGLIYSIPDSQRTIPSDMQFDYNIAGLDFGFKNPTALSVIGVSSQRYFVRDELYRPDMTTTDIISALHEYNKKYNFDKIYCDSARPEIIEEIRLSGLPAEGAPKGSGSVFAGIMHIKGLIGTGDLYVSKECRYHTKEIDSYVWAKTREKDSREMPLKINDHAMDAMRYGIYGHSVQFGDFVSSDKLLELHKLI